SAQRERFYLPAACITAVMRPRCPIRPSVPAPRLSKARISSSEWIEQKARSSNVRISRSGGIKRWSIGNTAALTDRTAPSVPHWQSRESPRSGRPRERHESLRVLGASVGRRTTGIYTVTVRSAEEILFKIGAGREHQNE